MNALQATTNRTLQAAMTRSPKVSAREMCEILNPVLDEASLSVSQKPGDLDITARSLKDAALTYCANSMKIVEQISSGEIPAGKSDEPFLASQLDWKDNMQRAAYTMFTAGALEGVQAYEGNLAPLPYKLPNGLRGGRLDFHLDRTVEDVNLRGEFVTAFAEWAHEREGTSSLKQIDAFQDQLDTLDLHVPIGGPGQVRFGRINEVMWTSYEFGVHAGILHSQDKLHLDNG